MDPKKQAYIAAALTKEFEIDEPQIVKQEVPLFFQGLVPPLTQAVADQVGNRAAQVAAKASDDWDADNMKKPAPPTPQSPAKP